MANPLLCDSTWLQQTKYEEAEAHYQQVLAGTAPAVQPSGKSPGGGGNQKAQKTKSTNKPQGSTLKSEIAQARQNIQKALNEPSPSPKAAPAVGDTQLAQRLKTLEDENNNLKKASQDLTELVKKLEARVSALEKSNTGASPAAPAAAAPKGEEPKPAEKPKEDSESEEDFFGSDDDESEDEETKAKLAAYHAKKQNKPKVIAKSSLLLDVKPWDDETDMADLEKCVRSIEMPGLLWGASKLVPVGYGIHKLQINAVIEDDLVSVDDMEEKITGFEDLVQSMDIAAFNKI